MPGTQGVGTADLPCRPSRLLCPEYRRGAQKVPERCPVKHRQQPGRTPQPGNCDHPKELSLCRKRGRWSASRNPVFIRCNMQSKRHLLSQMARRRSAAPGKRNPDRIRRPPAPSLETDRIIHQNHATTPPLAAKHVAGWALTFPSHHGTASTTTRLH